MLVAPLRCCVAAGLLVAAAPLAAAWGAPSACSATLLSDAQAWTPGTVAALGKVRADASPLESAGNILALYYDAADNLNFRVSLVAPVGIRDGVDHFTRNQVRVYVLLDEGPGGETRLPPPLEGPSPIAWERSLRLDAPGVAAPAASASVSEAGGGWAGLAAEQVAFHLDRGWLAAALPHGAAAPTQAAVITVAGGRVLDRLVAPLGAAPPTYSTHVAWVHHGNQGLAYSDVFFGGAGREGSSGFDEILEAHQLVPRIPGNFHLSALLQSSAEWDARNGAPVDFNAWLRAGVTEGWVGMLSSAYGQPIMPFLQGAMNEWAVNRDAAMVSFRYGYTPRVGWVPERVWLSATQYPSNGVSDYSGNHWQGNGVNAVILDDWPHGQGYDNHQIHTLAGSGLRVVLRDGNFTGLMHAGNGAGALQVLTDLANSPVGPYRIVVYADDWEMAAEMGNWQFDFPYALDAYEYMINKCRTESAWLSTWKLADALGNPDFNGSPAMSATHGVYPTIGGTAGYGGNNNAWYADWAGFVPYANGGNGNGGCAGSGGNCKNHGQLWNDAHLALQAAPNNNIREAGWYVMMTNLHETGWHDYLGGPLSGWERQYSAKIKNANIYAEAARWAGGLYASPTGCFFSDIDNDGYNEIVMHNDRVFAVFESIGGRCTHLFAKGTGYDYSVVGIDNAYWAGTEGDYNDVNHVAALSDVGPNSQHDFYGMSVDVASGNTVRATFTHAGVRKTVSLTLGQPYLDCVYRVGSNTQYIQSGWSPDIVDLLYNAELYRVWGGGYQTYMGQRNPNTAATAAYVLGGGRAHFSLSFTSTLMKVDEIAGTQKFQFYLYAGTTSPPDGMGHIAELETLKNGLTDMLAPEAVGGTYFPATRQLALAFDEPVQYDQVVVTAIALDDDNDGVADATLDAGTAVLTGTDAATLTLQVSSAVHDAIQALDHNQMRLLLQPGAVRDVAGNLAAQLTNAGNVFVSYGPPTLLTLDGRFDPSEWPDCAVAVADSFDSQWNAGPNDITNEIQALYATWDSTYLYLGVRGVATANSWLLYLDTDPGGPNGQTNLTAINTWERGAVFTAPGFKPDWQFGAYQHQGGFDSQSFFKITSATTTQDSTPAILKAFDPMHAYGLNGGSEIAIPWNTLYALGAGRVPNGAQLGLVASLCWDPEPLGELGGDQAPNNLAATPPTLDNRKLLTLDANGDGYPDPIDRAPPALLSATAVGNDSVIMVAFNEPVFGPLANQASRYAVFPASGPALTVKSAALQSDSSTVRLVVSPMSYVSYTVAASGIADASCFRNVANQTSVQFTGPPVSVDPARAAAGLELSAPYPNPTAGAAAIEYALPATDGAAARAVRLALYDLGGRRARTLVSAPQAPGVYRVPFNGRDDRGERLAPGVYFVQLSWGKEQRVRRLIMLP